MDNVVKVESISEASLPGKLFYGLVGVGAAITFGVVVSEMYVMGITFIPMLVALVSLTLAVYCVFKTVKVWTANKEATLEQHLEANRQAA